jgi:HD-GYP domain-containing protein (c-di-GMP phosphodiesterase class II)
VSQKTDYLEKVKLKVGDLRPGMYVCELDRPWLETPFLFQGFEVKSDEDIATVARHCEYVYIDLARTRHVEIALDAAPPPRSYTNPRANHSFEREIATAQATRERTSGLVKSFLDEIRFGKSVDVNLAKAAVSECVASIMRNPDAMMFMARMRGKDEGLSQQAFNGCIYAVMLGTQAGLEPRDLENLGTCGLLRDVGKVSVPDHILNKPGRLDPEELAVARSHAVLGRDILMSGRNTFSGAVDVAYGHHEHLDGTGYPRGLEGHQLNLNCKIVAVVDRYDALISARPFRPAYHHLDALRILNKMMLASHLDNALTTAFIACLGVYPPGSVVELSNGEVAIVLQSNPKQRLKPQILVVRDTEARPVETLVDMALRDHDAQGRPYKIKAVHRPEDFGLDLEKYRGAILQSMG